MSVWSKSVDSQDESAEAAVWPVIIIIIIINKIISSLENPAVVSVSPKSLKKKKTAGPQDVVDIIYCIFIYNIVLYVIDPSHEILTST